MARFRSIGIRIRRKVASFGLVGYGDLRKSDRSRRPELGGPAADRSRRHGHGASSSWLPTCHRQAPSPRKKSVQGPRPLSTAQMENLLRRCCSGTAGGLKTHCYEEHMCSPLDRVWSRRSVQGNSVLEPWARFRAGVASRRSEQGGWTRLMLRRPARGCDRTPCWGPKPWILAVCIAEVARNTCTTNFVTRRRRRILPLTTP